MFSIIRRTYRSASGLAGSRIWVAPSQEENSRGCLSTDSVSACLSTSQNPGPPGHPASGRSSTQVTGPAARSRASAANGTPVT